MPRKFHSRRTPAARKAGFRLPRAFGVSSLILCTAVFFIGYLAQVNATSSKGYQIRSLESAISDLKDQGEKLELRVAQEQSVQSVEEKVRSMGMVPAPDVQYVQPGSSAVAQR